ncbi:phage tail tape measure protein [Bacillus gobiensis]|uniref:phage tail tape measure protein n=1 Tax=Bacillus gobiensis TaxID=1441095 RepID=UPI003D1EF51D
MADVGVIRARLELDSSEFERRTRQAREEMLQMSRSASGVSRSMSLIQTSSLAVGGAVAAGIGAAVKSAATFEKQMSAVAAVSGASQEEMQKLSDLAIKAGESTSYSATEAAMGIEELIKAGVSVTDILNGGLQGALDLSAAGTIELADAAEIASTALNAYRDDNLKVSDAANILAGAANSSATDVGELKYGLSAVSAVASGAGMTFQDTATALAVFAQNGLKGSDSGTSLKTMLSNLQPTTKAQTELFFDLGLMTEDGTNKFYDQEGSLRSLSEISGLLHNSMKDMTDQQRQLTLETLFGSDAVRAGTILYKEGADGINEMWDAMSKVTAADVAKTKLDNLIGSFEEFKGALETLGIKVGSEFLPTFRAIVDTGTDIVRLLSDLNPSVISTGLEMAGTAAAIGLVVSSVAKLSLALRGLFLSMGPGGWVILGISLIGGALVGLNSAYKEHNDITIESAQAKQDEIESLNTLADEFDGLRIRMTLTNDEIGRYLDINDRIKNETDPEAIKKLKDEQEGLRDKSGLTNDEFQRFLDLNDKIIEKAPETNAAFTSEGNAIAKNTDAIRKLSHEKAESLRLDLELARNNAEKDMASNLEKQRQYKADINRLSDERADKEAAVNRQVEIVGETEAKITAAKAVGNKAEAAAQEVLLEGQQLTLDALRKQLGTNLENIKAKEKSLNKVNQEIGKLDKVKQQMVDLELRQVGLTAKKGEGVKVIDKEISKLQKQKTDLDKNTGAAMKKTKEYQDAVSAIDREISSLNTAKSRVQEITGEAGAMNRELGKDITKNVRIVESLSRVAQTRGKSPQMFHTGGVIGVTKELPKLHTGGLASQFSSPMAHEVDIRALKNEMVLTESQQSNLFRMIDAGIIGGGNGGDTFGATPEVISLLSKIAQGVQSDRSVTVTVDGDAIAAATYPHISSRQLSDFEREFRITGGKRNY